MTFNWQLCRIKLTNYEQKWKTFERKYKNDHKSRRIRLSMRRTNMHHNSVVTIDEQETRR